MLRTASYYLKLKTILKIIAYDWLILSHFLFFDIRDCEYFRAILIYNSIFIESQFLLNNGSLCKILLIYKGKWQFHQMAQNSFTLYVYICVYLLSVIKMRVCGNSSAQDERREVREYATHTHKNMRPWMKRLLVQAKEGGWELLHARVRVEQLCWRSSWRDWRRRKRKWARKRGKMREW